MISIFNFLFIFNILLNYFLIFIHCIDIKNTLSLDYQGNINKLKGPDKGVIHSSTVLPITDNNLGKLLILATYNEGIFQKHLLIDYFEFTFNSNDSRVILFATNERLICTFTTNGKFEYTIKSTEGDAIAIYGNSTYSLNNFKMIYPKELFGNKIWKNFFFGCDKTNKLTHLFGIDDKLVKSWNIVTPPDSWNYITSFMYPENIFIDELVLLITQNNKTEEYEIIKYHEYKNLIEISSNNKPQGIIGSLINNFIGIVLPPNMNYTIDIINNTIYASNDTSFYISNGIFNNTYIRYYTDSPWEYKVSFDKNLDNIIAFTKDQMKFGGPIKNKKLLNESGESFKPNINTNQQQSSKHFLSSPLEKNIINKLKKPDKGVIHSSTVLPVVDDDLGKFFILASYNKGILEKYTLSDNFKFTFKSNDNRIMLYTTNYRLICVFGTIKELEYTIKSTDGNAIITYQNYTFFFNNLKLASSEEVVRLEFWHDFFYDCNQQNRLKHVYKTDDKLVKSWNIVTPPDSWNYITSTIYPENIIVEEATLLITQNNKTEEYEIIKYHENEHLIEISSNNKLQGIIIYSTETFIGIVLPSNMNYTINIIDGTIYASNGNHFYIPNGFFNDTYIKYFTNSPWEYKISFDKDLDNVIAFTKDQMKFGGPIKNKKLFNESGESSIPNIKSIKQQQSSKSSFLFLLWEKIRMFFLCRNC